MAAAAVPVVGAALRVAGDRCAGGKDRIWWRLNQVSALPGQLTGLPTSRGTPRWLTQLNGICLAVLVLLVVLRQGAIAEPQLPALGGRVVDAAHVLDGKTIAQLSGNLRAYEARTSTQIVIVTLPDLQGYPIEQWGLALLRGWHIGQKGKNNGVVIILAPNDRQVRIETGYGAEGPLPDATASEIIRQDMNPRFKRGDFAGGLIGGVKRIETALETDFSAIAAGATDGRDFWHRISIPIVLAITSPLLLIFFVYLIIWSLRSQARFVSGSRMTRWRNDSWDNSTQWRSASSVDSSNSGFIDSFLGGGGSGGGGGASGSW